jgi:hypothetical protein
MLIHVSLEGVRTKTVKFWFALLVLIVLRKKKKKTPENCQFLVKNLGLNWLEFGLCLDLELGR